MQPFYLNGVVVMPGVEKLLEPENSGGADQWQLTIERDLARCAPTCGVRLNSLLKCATVRV